MPARVKEAEEQPAFGGNWMCEVGREGQGLSIVAHQLCEPGHITQFFFVSAICKINGKALLSSFPPQR